MHVGHMAPFSGHANTMTDAEIWAMDLALADLAEPLGFDSIWTVEHHFTRYHMTPNPLTFLTYMAGRTKHIKLGTAVVVLPWHNPLDVAEQITVLDNASRGRLILGLGRGTAKDEFDAFNSDMAVSRPRFRESAEMLLNALETGVMEYDGEVIKQRSVQLRPAPFASFKGRVFSASISPESSMIMAELGLGMFVVPQKPWAKHGEDIARYRRVYREVIDAEPPAPVMQTWCILDESATRAEERARKIIGEYWHSVVDHYGFDRPHLKDIPGYEFHGQMYDRLTRPGGMESMTEFYLNLQPWGTPEQVYEKIVGFANFIGADTFIGGFRFCSMNQEEGEKNMRLFAKEVLPELKKLPPVKEGHANPILEIA